MKRLAVLGIALLVLASFAFAEVKVEPTVSLSANATLTWGIDLETFDTGFANAADADLTVTFIAKDTKETKAGEGAAYGSITISDIEFYFGGNDAADDSWDSVSGWLADTDVSAKIVVGPVEISVYNAPGFSTGAFTSIENGDYDDDIVDDDESDYEAGGDPWADDTWGTSASMTLGPLAAKVILVSDGYDGTTADNNYAAGLEATLTAGPATVDFGGYGNWVGAAYGFYADVGIVAGPIDAWAGFMGNYVGAFGWEAGAGLTFTIIPDTTLDLIVNYGDTTNGLDLYVCFTEPGDAGFVPNLDASLTFFLLDVGAADARGIEYEAILSGGYKIAMNDTQSVRPYFGFTYGAGNDDAADLAMAYMTANVGAELNLIPLTTFTIDYSSGDLAQDVAEGADLGEFTVAAKVSY